MVTKWPGVGVAMAIALVPIGVAPPGVMRGVIAPANDGVCGVILAMLGVALPWLPAAGVSSQRLRRFEAEGVGVSWIKSPPRSVRGVSAHPEPKPGVYSPLRSVFGVSSHRFRLPMDLASSEPKPGVACPGVASQSRVLPGVTPPPAPGVSEPLPLAGVSSQRATAGVSASQADIFFLIVGALMAAAAGVPSSGPVWSQRAERFRGCSLASPFDGADTTFSVPSLALSAIFRRTYERKKIDLNNDKSWL